MLYFVRIFKCKKQASSSARLDYLSHDYCFLRTITNAMYNLTKNKVLDRTNNYRELLVTNRVKVVRNVHISRASAARGVEYKQRRVTLILYQNYSSFMCLCNENQTWFLLIISDYRNRKIYNAILLQNRKMF